jgi:hypothetical protein
LPATNSAKLNAGLRLVVSWRRGDVAAGVGNADAAALAAGAGCGCFGVGGGSGGAKRFGASTR